MGGGGEAGEERGGLGGWSGWGDSHSSVTIEKVGRLDLSKKY